MKIIYFGTPEIAVETLESLHKIPQIEILAVVTQQDKKTGRKQLLTPPPVKKTAIKHGLTVIQPKNKAQLTKELKKYEADFFLVFAFGMILPNEILQMPKQMAINIHTSLLPKYRGASPIQEALLQGDKETGISFIKISEKMDCGGILLIKRLEIEKNETQKSLTKKLAILSANLAPLVLEDVSKGNLPPIPQNEDHASYCKKIEKKDALINWNYSAKDINNMVRAYNPWPIAYTEIKGKKLKILEADYSEEEREDLKSGQFKIENKKLKIGTAKGALLPRIIQLEGKKEMDISSFINGYGLQFFE